MNTLSKMLVLVGVALTILGLIGCNKVSETSVKVEFPYYTVTERGTGVWTFKKDDIVPAGFLSMTHVKKFDVTDFADAKKQIEAFTSRELSLCKEPRDIVVIVKQEAVSASGHTQLTIWYLAGEEFRKASATFPDAGDPKEKAIVESDENEGPGSPMARENGIPDPIVTNQHKH